MGAALHGIAPRLVSEPRDNTSQSYGSFTPSANVTVPPSVLMLVSEPGSAGATDSTSLWMNLICS